MYAFNHDEAIRSFAARRGARPDVRDGVVGVAVCEGPNYNDPVMTQERSAAAWGALQEALARVDGTSPVERALIEALAQRYAKPWPEDRSDLDRAYADAMAQVWADHSDDSDVGTLYAESLMILRPWKLYTIDREPVEDTATIVATLERVMELDPGNPGANHLYIHAVEPSLDPDRGAGAADRLGTQVPRRRAPEPHAVAHLRADRPVGRLDRAQRPRDGGGRPLPHALPGPGHPAHVHGPQRPHAGVLRDDGRARGGGHGRGARHVGRPCPTARSCPSRLSSTCG